MSILNLKIIYSSGLTSKQNIIAELEAKSGNALVNILVYAKPTSDRLYLQGVDVEDSFAWLLDINGRAVKQVNNSNSIELNGLSEEFYFGRIKTHHHIKVFKVFVEK